MLSNIFTVAFFVSLLSATIRLATPLLLPALGQLYTQRAGILNLGVEGTMLMGAIASFAAACATGSLWFGLLVGILAGALYSAIMAWLSVTMCSNQVIAGIGMNILATGLAVYIYRLIFGIRSLPAQLTTFQALHFPVLSDIPYLGELLFKHNIMVYLAFLMVPVTWFILEKTTFGLKIKAVGENPAAVDSKGLSVSGLRYAAVIIGGAYAGAGGAFMTIAYMGLFTESIIGGFGYIAVSVVIFSRLQPGRCVLGAMLFGCANALQLRLQALGINVAPELMMMLPYVMTIIALVVSSKKAAFPAAYTVPYSRNRR